MKPNHEFFESLAKQINLYAAVHGCEPAWVVIDPDTFQDIQATRYSHHHIVTRDGGMFLMDLRIIVGTYAGRTLSRDRVIELGGAGRSVVYAEQASAEPVKYQLRNCRTGEWENIDFETYHQYKEYQTSARVELRVVYNAPALTDAQIMSELDELVYEGDVSVNDALTIARRIEAIVKGDK